MELLYGTTNEGKLLVMRRVLSPLGITVTGLKDQKTEIPVVPETGNSPLENARLKAKAYFKAFQMPVFSCDTGLYFKNVPDEFQPGIYVRRPLGYEMTDEEMTEYYKGLAEHFGVLHRHIPEVSLAFPWIGCLFRFPAESTIMTFQNMLRMKWLWTRACGSFSKEPSVLPVNNLNKFLQQRYLF